MLQHIPRSQRVGFLVTDASVESHALDVRIIDAAVEKIVVVEDYISCF